MKETGIQGTFASLPVSVFGWRTCEYERDGKIGFYYTVLP